MIADEYAKHFTAKKLGQLSPAEADFFNSWAKKLHDEFKSETNAWQSIEANPERAARTFDQLAQEKTWNLPSAVIATASAAMSVWANCTIAFDPQQEKIDPTDPNALRLIVALRLMQLRAEGTPIDAKCRAALQEAITTPTSSGLSWLFGVGFKQLRESESETAACAGLGAPQTAVQSVAKLREAAFAIQSDPLFGADSYADYRRLVGGRLDSWIANYLSRLLQLQQLLNQDAERFVLDPSLVQNWEKLFGRLPLNATQVQALLDAALQHRDKAKSALDALLGAKQSLPTSSDLEAVDRYSALASEAVGALRSLKNVLEPSESGDSRRDIDMPAAHLVKPPLWLDELPRLNSFSGAIPDFKQEVEEAAEALQKLDMEYAALSMDRLLWSQASTEGSNCEVFDKLLRRNQSGMTGRISSGPDAVEQTLRTVLQRFGRAALGCSLPAREPVGNLYVCLGVFANPKDANRFFINQQGSLYRSPYSRSRHQPYALGEVTRYAHSIPIQIRGFSQQLAEDLGIGITRADLLKLRHSADSIFISALDTPIPSLNGLIQLDERYVRIPASIKLAMQASTWDPALVARFFNLLLQARLAMWNLLGRQKFYVRARFQRVGDTSLSYRPKPTKWILPARLINTRKPIGDALRTLGLKASDSTASLDTPEALQNILKARSISGQSLTAYLQQAPHDWFYHPGLRGEDDEKSPGWLTVSGKDGAAKKTKKCSRGWRLIGPPSYKSELDKLLKSERGPTFGDVTLIFDQEFEQKLVTAEDGSLRPHFTERRLTTAIAIPLTTTAGTAEKFPLPDRLVAIDQGEAGIGFGVLDIRTGEVIASGSRRIPSIRRLINKARQYRSVRQKSQKFQQRFDSTLFAMRENVVGDVCHVICELMHAYKAFPVIESQVKNLEGGSRQLDLVYKAVSTRFTYSDVPAHNTERKTYWMGGDSWAHPYLRAKMWEDGKPSNKEKPLNLFPGALGPTAGTSQQCSKCKRNPIMQLREWETAGTKTVPVEGGGYVTLTDGRIRLLQPTDDPTRNKQARRRNERIHPDTPITAGSRSLPDLIALARRNLRLPPLSRQSRDTTQSLYRCLYVDCLAEMHADENAAKNIGRRFLERMIVPKDQPA